MKLSSAEIAFLRHHNIPVQSVLDGQMYTTPEWQSMLSQDGKLLAIRKKPCANAGHRLFDRYNHCVQCHPQYLKEVERFYTPGYVYIKGSRKGNLLKIGCSEYIASRTYKLSYESYGGYDDWELLFSVKVSGMKRIESDAQTLLDSKRVVREYFKDKVKSQDAKEMFQCTYTEVINAIFRAVKNSGKGILSDPEQFEGRDYFDKH